MLSAARAQPVTRKDVGKPRAGAGRSPRRSPRRTAGTPRRVRCANLARAGWSTSDLDAAQLNEGVHRPGAGLRAPPRPRRGDRERGRRRHHPVPSAGLLQGSDHASRRPTACAATAAIAGPLRRARRPGLPPCSSRPSDRPHHEREPMIPPSAQGPTAPGLLVTADASVTGADSAIRRRFITAKPEAAARVPLPRAGEYEGRARWERHPAGSGAGPRAMPIGHDHRGSNGAAHRRAVETSGDPPLHSPGHFRAQRSPRTRVSPCSAQRSLNESARPPGLTRT
ncbi:hypothetical protein FB558_0364 [Pseudonocardia kunmingensis]|uniref:Uncharacterized protein n=1 Tax=Pseudonocardia kunmingensis TaxID=630975 RepID=A0A543DWB9_9PSEU|nr:hypothetical protein FB558_0364 [Pseudonocardia kunmingensis]